MGTLLRIRTCWNDRGLHSNKYETHALNIKHERLNAISKQGSIIGIQQQFLVDQEEFMRLTADQVLYSPLFTLHSVHPSPSSLIPIIP